MMYQAGSRELAVFRRHGQYVRRFALDRAIILLPKVNGMRRD